MVQLCLYQPVLFDSHTICQMIVKEPRWLFRTITLHLVNTCMAHLVNTWPMHICLHLELFLWNEYNLLVIYSPTRTVKSVSRKAHSGEMMFIKLYALCSKSEEEQEALEAKNSELLSNAFQEIFSFPIIFS